MPPFEHPYSISGGFYKDIWIMKKTSKLCVDLFSSANIFFVASLIP
jgi:hypothetical protein